ncbi:hypothetical protein FIBSPDRAFT_184699 [Athelia psychrophila]|uniref:Uncharacterized protein n=1 Tax=Athelia psychrophila TaxID=1759441 RepID=A0A166ACU8_9AGAM|nr:hypothetical protein FIBSPDRAFT_184699 [Fibularhizoctonia sp. CBS 109695]
MSATLTYEPAIRTQWTADSSIDTTQFVGLRQTGGWWASGGNQAISQPARWQEKALSRLSTSRGEPISLNRLKDLDACASSRYKLPTEYEGYTIASPVRLQPRCGPLFVWCDVLDSLKYNEIHRRSAISRRVRSPCRRRTPPATITRMISNRFPLYEDNCATNLLLDLLLLLLLGSSSRCASSSGGGGGSTSSSAGRDRGELCRSLGDQLFSWDQHCI